MRRTGRLLLPLLAAAAWSAASGTEFRLPAASQARPAPADGAAVVHVTAHGEIQVDREGRSESVSLDQLATWLEGRRDRFEAAARAKGGPGGSDGLPVLLRVDRDAPWRHAQWVLWTCARAGLRRTELAAEGPDGAEGRLRAPLPADAALPEEGLLRITVAILVKGEELATWGPTQSRIRRPTEIGYRMLDREAPEIEAVRRFIRDAHQAASAVAGVRIVGDVDPEARIAYGDVIAVLDEFHRAGLADVRFRAAEPPSDAQRREPRLSYPDR